MSQGSPENEIDVSKLERLRFWNRREGKGLGELLAYKQP